MSMDIKLSKAQLPKINQLRGFIDKMLKIILAKMCF